MENEERLTQLEAEVDVLRAYVRGLIALLPTDSVTNGHLFGIVRQINADSQHFQEPRRSAMQAANRALDAAGVHRIAR
jgi:hypothetical protein